MDKVIKIIVCFICLATCACSIIPSSNTTNATPIFTDVSSFTPNDQLVINPLPRFDDYIIYSKYEISNGVETWWAINSTNSTPQLISPHITPRCWSPSNKLWLFTGNQSIYVANSDGSDLHALYSYKGYEGVDPFWLTDSQVLFNAYEDFPFSPPDMYSLDINNGVVTQLFPESDKFIQNVFPFEKAWLLGDWATGSLDIVTQDGRVTEFFDDLSILADPFDSSQIQRIEKLDKYLVVAKGTNGMDYKLWLVSESEAPQLLFDPGNDGVNYFVVSPDEQFLALTFVSSTGTYVYFLNLENRHLDYAWPCPYKIGACEYMWSPDSQSIVLPYCDFDVCSGANVGIQIMEITTGATRIILKDDVTQISDWHSIN